MFMYNHEYYNTDKNRLDYGTQHIGGTGDGQSPAAWRFPLALQTLPSMILAAGTLFLPYSPRWLMSKGILNLKRPQNHLSISNS
jgi:hypothetical protein